jgi:two-component system, probable response regulator PhcQ
MLTQTILIVDDDENILKSIKRTLMDDNYNILTAMSGQEGLAKLKKHDVSLVVSDQKMPGMSGLEFLEKIKIDYPEILTIMLTSHADIEITIKAINEAGVYKFILKPWDEANFRMTIRRAIETRQLIKERDSLLQKVQTHETILRDLEKKQPGITKVERDEHGYVLTLD